jgi:hypothetical protein
MGIRAALALDLVVAPVVVVVGEGGERRRRRRWRRGRKWYQLCTNMIGVTA